MAKGVILTTAIGEFDIKESVEEILKRKNATEETGDLNFTICNLKDPKHKGYNASVLAGAYRAVREIEMPSKK